MREKSQFVFIVGSPRSGTTLLGNILNKHEAISQWYEPYFVWDKYFREANDDVRTPKEASDKVSEYIRKSFVKYRERQNSQVVVDKSPRNSLKIPFIAKIFPEASFIHILRDGRDVTLSINKEWLRRQSIVEGSGSVAKFNHIEAFKVVNDWLNRQPFFSDRMKALWFETRGHIFDKSKQLNRKRWDAWIGWGPRFGGWREYLSSHSVLQFNAMQWVKCIEGVKCNWSYNISERQRLEIRYEDLIGYPEEVLERILHFMGLGPSRHPFRMIPELKTGNFGKWKNQLSPEELDEIRPILTPLLEELGYAEQHPW